MNYWYELLIQMMMTMPIWWKFLWKAGTFFITMSPALRTEPKSQSLTREKSDLNKKRDKSDLVIISSLSPLSSEIKSNQRNNRNKKCENKGDQKEEKVQLWRHWQTILMSSPPTPHQKYHHQKHHHPHPTKIIPTKKIITTHTKITNNIINIITNRVPIVILSPSLAWQGSPKYKNVVELHI